MKYTKLVLEVVTLESDDVITTSLTNGGSSGNLGEFEWMELVTNADQKYEMK